ncbi:hypothetical protein UMC2_00861 [[Clostridium] sordellii]|nr:hypothetical protein UMC2_00861 [[Clostridium] sordellii] [Paeniclostridium sordellii]
MIIYGMRIVIGENVVVLVDVPSGCIAVGSPVRIINKNKLGE